MANELVEEKVDIILAGGTIGAQVAKNATVAIPIVAAGAGDLVDAGIVKSLAEPGGNVTGFTANAPEAGVKRIEIMKEIIATADRAAILFGQP